MAHSKADVIQSRVDLTNAIQREISIHRGYIAALENALRGLQMVTAMEPEQSEDAKPSSTQLAVEARAKGFVQNLTDKIAAATNGQAS